MGKSGGKIPLYFDPQLLREAEDVLRDHETLSELAERSLRENILFRLARQDLLQRGLTSRDDAKHTGRYLTFEEVLSRLDLILRTSAETRKKRDSE